jgi:L-lactate dehydrogenase complex protein LldG
MGREDFFSMLKIVEIGISIVDLAVAETGTLVTTTWDESERLVTALPKIHVALVSRSRLVSSLREAETYVSEVLSQSGGGVAVSLISASSRTADIGDMVILGVHGPRDLHVLFVDEELPGD